MDRADIKAILLGIALLVLFFIAAVTIQIWPNADLRPPSVSASNGSGLTDATKEPQQMPRLNASASAQEEAAGHGRRAPASHSKRKHKRRHATPM